jgi:hypothetical protein
MRENAFAAALHTQLGRRNGGGGADNTEERIKTRIAKLAATRNTTHNAITIA